LGRFARAAGVNDADNDGPAIVRDLGALEADALLGALVPAWVDSCNVPAVLGVNILVQEFAVAGGLIVCF